MKFTDRTYFTYDPALGTVGDTVTALAMHDEYVRKYCPNPMPIFFEVDRSTGVGMDPMWGNPTAPRTQFSRQLSIPAINNFDSQKFRVWWNKVTTRGDRFWMSNLGLQAANYFPVQGDQVYWTGYRLTIINVNVPPESYWGQTGVWLGLVVDCVLAPYGDALPPSDLSKLNPGEFSGAGNKNLGGHGYGPQGGYTPVLPQPFNQSPTVNPTHAP